MGEENIKSNITVTMPVEEYNRLLSIEKVSHDLSVNNAHLLFFVEQLDLLGFEEANSALNRRGHRITRQAGRYKIEKITK